MGLVALLQKHGYEVIALNPLIPQRARKSKLRKVKTDTEDAKHLAELYYKDELQPGPAKRSMELDELRFLSRQHQMINHSYVQAQLNFQSILDQLFPLYTNIFGQLFSATALEVLRKYPTPKFVLSTTTEEITDTIMTFCNRSINWESSKATAIVAAAKSSLIIDPNASQVTALRLMINLLMEYQSHLANLEQEIQKKASCIAGYELLRSIPGIGPKLAAVILSEIGDISSFDHALLRASAHGRSRTTCRISTAWRSRQPLISM
ncbi:IS110 family transposase [Cohnella hashimotonis]|uniref:Transposase n=1 Tax=Cohnella hashimotonis TaxID=2826895 RepID=A0ABT6TRX5_9BACL|nr:transposase [Cohnella hashimotonis]MDI4649090.1 transposase [Cohnella hashimotonis]